MQNKCRGVKLTIVLPHEYAGLPEKTLHRIVPQPLSAKIGMTFAESPQAAPSVQVENHPMKAARLLALLLLVSSAFCRAQSASANPQSASVKPRSASGHSQPVTSQPLALQPTVEIAPPSSPAVQRQTLPAASEPALTHAAKLRLLREKIKYVFVLFQENRSFDFYFSTYPGASTPTPPAIRPPDSLSPSSTSTAPSPPSLPSKSPSPSPMPKAAPSPSTPPTSPR
jgi:hypothetical protein